MPLYRTSYFWRLLSLPERVGLPLLSSPREDRVPVSTVLPFPDLSGRGLLPVFRDSIWFIKRLRAAGQRIVLIDDAQFWRLAKSRRGKAR